MDELIAVLTLRAGYNTAVVMLGAALLGLGAGAIGTFTLLRKRTLISDAISHATLPGVALGFLVAVALGGEGRNLPVLLLGAAGSGAFGVVCVQWIKDHTRLPEDAAIGTVLSVFFGAGIVLLSHIQTLSVGGQAGLESFLLGSTAGMLQSEAELIGVAAAVVILLVVLFLKEFGAVCFDPAFAEAQGWPVARIDLLMMALLLAIVAIGLKTVGLILIIALVIIPPVAARFWTDRLPWMLVIAAAIGGVSAYVGAAASAVLPELPAGATIVLTAALLFALSLLAAPRRGLIADRLRQLRFRLAVAERRALLALARGSAAPDGLGRLALRWRGFLDRDGRPTPAGLRAARAAARDQALWDRFHQDYPEEAFAHPDWVTAQPDRVLPADLVAELERRVAAAEGRAAWA